MVLGEGCRHQGLQSVRKNHVVLNPPDPPTHLQIVKKLLGQGVSASCCDYDKRSPLMVSAQEGKESIVKLLVESKANVHALDIFGGNALLGAVKMGHHGVIHLLMQNQAR